MTTGTTETSERDDDGDVETDAQPRTDGVSGILQKSARTWPIAAVAGGVLLARALRSTRRGGRAAVQGLAGAALLALGVRQWRRQRATPATGDWPTDRVDGGTEVSDEARAHAERSDVLHQDEANPRGTSGEPAVATETGPDEGSVRFTTEGQAEPRDAPSVDGDAPGDPRLDDAVDAGDPVEVDLSETSMADEASEATGPAPEQSQPASTEGTEPEPTPDEDASHVAADAPDGTDGETEADAGPDESGSDERRGDTTES